jgi:hypothetical protein
VSVKRLPEVLFLILVAAVIFGINYGVYELQTGKEWNPPQEIKINELQAEVQQLRADSKTLQIKLTNEELIRQDLEHRLRVVERRNMINVEAE